MKKLTLLFAVAFALVGSTMAQMAINGSDFANHPERFSNKPVTIKNVNVVVGDNHGGGHHGGGMHGGMGHHEGPGGPGGHAAPCRAPQGSEEIKVEFNGNPGFSACFFAQSAMARQIKGQARGGQPVPMILSIKGNQQTGYMITSFKVGH